jgi:hypothetical protein
VETLEGSVSLAHLSHDDFVRGVMETLYKLTYKFDLIHSPRGKRFALRLFLDMMVHELVGNAPNETANFFENLITTRYQDPELAGSFGRVGNLCDAGTEPKGKIPISQDVFVDCTSDMRLASRHFDSINVLEVRDVLFADYVEEITANVVGVANVLPFFRHCFRGQEYELTDPNSDAHHELWRYYDEVLDGSLE